VQAACLEARRPTFSFAHDVQTAALPSLLRRWLFVAQRCRVGATSISKGQFLDINLLFSEITSRIVISFRRTSLGAIKEIAARSNCPLTSRHVMARVYA